MTKKKLEESITLTFKARPDVVAALGKLTAEIEKRYTGSMLPAIGKRSEVIREAILEKLERLHTKRATDIEEERRR